jgi:hypothetical protein
MTKLRYLHSIGRCGGTIISRCLGAMRGVLLLSEIHPEQSAFDPLLQTKNWHGFPSEEEYPELVRRLSFYGKLAYLKEEAEQRGLHLVVRDWAYRDFSFPADRPRYRLATLDALAPLDPEPLRVSIVRHPMQQWLSLFDTKFINKDEANPESYFQIARLFAELVASRTKFVKYEDFGADPQNGMVLLCEKLELTLDPEWSRNWRENHRVTGDPTLLDEIVPPKIREPPPGALERFLRNHDYRDACRTLGYDPERA